MNETLSLPPLSFKIPPSWSEARRGGASAAGYHAVSEWMTCPERARLSRMGVRFTADPYADGGLNELDFGTLIHTLRGIRIAHGMIAMVHVLDAWRLELGDETYARAMLIMQTYDQLFPIAHDPLIYFGIETEVRTNIGSAATPIIRTVRYDTLVYALTTTGEKELYSFECKTSARSGQGVLFPYYGQAMVQMSVWNANPALVEQYGVMRGVIFDLIVKTKMPSVDRIPRTFSRRQQNLALDYLRLPDNGGATYGVQHDGTYPRMLHACWGRWRPCEFIDLCHEGSYGSYEMDGSVVTPEMLYPQR